MNGERCNYHKQWSQEVINAAVEEVIYKLVQNPKFEAQIKKKIGSRIDTTELETEVSNLMKQLRQKENAKDRLANELDRLDQDDRMYERKYLDMQNRLYSFYDEIALLEDRIVEVNQRIDNIRKQRITGDQVYQILLVFDKMYGEFSDLEKKRFMQTFIEQVDIYPQKQESGQILKNIKFKFPIYFQDEEVDMFSWDGENTAETVVLLRREK